MTTSESSRLRLVVVGWGAIARAMSRLLRDRGAPVEIVAVAIRDLAKPRRDLPPKTLQFTSPQDLTQLEADMVVEAASSHAVAPWGRAALEAGLDFVVTSVSALADSTILADLTDLAVRNRAQIHISPGALGGLDALTAARVMGIDAVEHRIIKPPQAWLGTPAEHMCNLDELTRAKVFFRGTAIEAASQFPQNANATITTGLAGTGPATTQVVLVADPDTDINRHEIRASGKFGELSVALGNKPLDENPKSSAMTALNLVRCVENRLSAVVI